MSDFFEQISVYQEAVFSIVFSFLSYAFFLLALNSHQIRKRLERKFGKEKSKIYRTLLQRGTGILLYGIIPAFLFSLVFSKKFSAYGLAFKNFTESLLWTLALSLVIIPINFKTAKNPSYHKKYPEIQTAEWDAGLLFISAFSWILYLFAYEWLFRGVLFFSCLRSFGLWPAVLINIVIYTAFHLHKGWKEMVGSVFLGSIFCLLTHKTGTLWTSFFSHAILALSNEWLSIYFNPQMKIKRRGKTK